MSRNEILERIGKAGQFQENPLPDRLPRFPQGSLDRFRKELEAVQGRFLFGRTESEFQDSLQVVIRESHASSIFWETPGMLKEHGISCYGPDLDRPEHCWGVTPIGLEPVSLPLYIETVPCQGSRLPQVELSASSALCGIAETGTVVEGMGPGHSRAFPVLPASHLVLLSEENLISNHQEFFLRFVLSRHASLMTMVTGPSRTADIEKTLIVGVHGPRQLFLILTR